jgi:hypothetical protein
MSPTYAVCLVKIANEGEKQHFQCCFINKYRFQTFSIVFWAMWDCQGNQASIADATKSCPARLG